jgi:hypothetical protein
LPGYSLKGVTLTAPTSVPGSADVDPEIVTTCDSRPGSTAPKYVTFAPAVSRTPAMPPAVRPWGRTTDAL